MGDGKKRIVLGSIESRFLDSVRAVLVVAIVLAALAVVAAAVSYVAATLRSSPGFADRFDPPDWEDVRPEVLPLAAPQARGDTREQADPSTAGIDPRFAEIGDSLNKQFARNPGQETAFTDAYPRRVLASWVDERAGVPEELREDFVGALRRVSRNIGEDPVINRIGSVPDRADTIRDALAAYRDEYVRRAAAVRDEVAEGNRALEAERHASTANALVLGGGGAAILVFLLLVVVLMRMEIHLRRIVDLGPDT